MEALRESWQLSLATVCSVKSPCIQPWPEPSVACTWTRQEASALGWLGKLVESMLGPRPRLPTRIIRQYPCCSLGDLSQLSGQWAYFPKQQIQQNCMCVHGSSVQSSLPACDTPGFGKGFQVQTCV